MPSLCDYVMLNYALWSLINVSVYYLIVCPTDNETLMRFVFTYHNKKVYFLNAQRDYNLAFLRKAFIVPETAKTCTAASLPATDVIEANEALTKSTVASEVRIIAVFFSTS